MTIFQLQLTKKNIAPEKFTKYFLLNYLKKNIVLKKR